MILTKPSSNVRVLADGDAFYASCEIARNPHLKWKIVIVERLDKCMACSYEWKRLWISIKTPLWEVRRMLKWQEYYVFDWGKWMWYYDRKSDEVFWFLEEQCGNRMKFSVDESFYDRTSLGFTTSDQVVQYATQLQEHLLQATWMPISFGFWRTKLVAKMFNKFRKPLWVYGHLEQEKITLALADLPVQAIPFIGKKRARKIPRVQTVWDYMNTRGEDIRKELKRDWLKLWLELHGYNAMRVIRKWWPSCIVRTKSFHPHFTNDKDKLRRKLITNFEKMYSQAVDENLAVKCMMVWLRYKVIKHWHSRAEQSFPKYTLERTYLLHTLRQLFEQAYTQWEWISKWVLYRWTSVFVSDIVYQEYREKSLFDVDHQADEDEVNQQQAQKAIEAINLRLWWMHITTASNIDALKKLDDNDEFVTMESY